MAYYNVMFDRAIDELWLQARDRAGLHEGAPRLDLHRRMPCALSARDSSRRSRADFGLSGRRRREAAAHVRGTAPRHRGLAVRDVGKHDDPHRHEARARSRRFRPTSAPASRRWWMRMPRSRGPRASAARSRCPRNRFRFRPAARLVQRVDNEIAVAWRQRRHAALHLRHRQIGILLAAARRGCGEPPAGPGQHIGRAQGSMHPDRGRMLDQRPLLPACRLRHNCRP